MSNPEAQDLLRQALKAAFERRDLDRAQSRAVLECVFRGEADEVLLAAWLSALAMKGEAATELAGAVEAMRAHALSVQGATPGAIDIVGTGGDGLHTYNISTLAAIIAAGAGAVVAKHGNRAFSSRSGSADVLAALGVRTECTPVTMGRCLREGGLAFLFATQLHPAVRHSAAVRRKMGVRTLFNLLGPLSNPAGIRRGLVGAYSERTLRLLAGAALELGMEHMYFVHGLDAGMDEFSLSGPSLVLELSGGAVRESVLRPADLGLSEHPLSALAGGSPQENASALRAVLEGGGSAAYRDAALASAAFGLCSAGLAPGPREAVALARQALVKGAALAKLETLIHLSNLDAPA